MLAQELNRTSPLLLFSAK